MLVVSRATLLTKMDNVSSFYSLEPSEGDELEPCEESSDTDGLVDAFGDLAALPVEADGRRPTCLRCW